MNLIYIPCEVHDSHLVWSPYYMKLQEGYILQVVNKKVGGVWLLSVVVTACVLVAMWQISFVTLQLCENVAVLSSL